ncbi:MAG TPA: hypothetical protein VFJ97_17280 [Dermatophilaceae bacterium]|nr:hypothetical protein [Dermatophilaceae bacterium]
MLQDNAVLDTAIGLAFVFFLTALICTAAVEGIANLTKKRAKFLLRGLRELLDQQQTAADPGRASRLADALRLRPTVAAGERRLHTDALTAGLHAVSPPIGVPLSQRLMGHPLVVPLKQTRLTGAGTLQVTRNPSYLPAATFARAVLDLAVPGADGQSTTTELTALVTTMEDSPLKQPLLSMLRTAGADIQRFTADLEAWYDAQMDRVSGAYKRWAKRWAIVVGLGVAGILNVDALAIAQDLYVDAPLRSAVVAAASSGNICPQDEGYSQTRDCVTTELSDLKMNSGLPVGWGDGVWPADLTGRALKVLGFGVTGFAASFGAPFWFDALGRLGSLRTAGKKPKSRTSAR